MNKHLILLIPTVVLVLLFAASGISQKTKAVDSLSYYLNSIKSSYDTNNVNMVFKWLHISEEDVLLNDEVMNKIELLKNTVDERHYYDIAANYFNSLINKNTSASNEKGILLMKRWLTQNENGKSKHAYYRYLEILRQLRQPFRRSGKLTEGIEYYSAAERKYLSVQDSNAVSIVYFVLSGFYYRLGLIEKTKYFQLKSIAYLNNSQKDYDNYNGSHNFGISGKMLRYSILGGRYIEQKKADSALIYLNKAKHFYSQLDSPLVIKDVPYLFLQLAMCKTLEKSKNSSSYYNIALEYLEKHNESPEGYAQYYQERAVDYISKNLLDSAMINIQKAIQFKDSFNLGIITRYGDLITGYYTALILIKKGNAKRAIIILQSEIKELRGLKNNPFLISELFLLAEAYTANGNTQEAYKILKEAFLLKEQMVAEQNDNRSLNFESEQKMQESENAIILLDAKNKANQKIKYYLFSIVGLLALFVIGLSVFYSNKRKSNRQLALKNERLAYTIQKLKSTQAQLIQSEKMASLGELTAGIAHEIQNPLNFVNNFSELNTELITELKDELAKGNFTEVEAIAADILENEAKINHHGQRASSIVKGMLEHSRTNSGQKELADINTLADEYLRLSYHGLRAKDKSFNATFETDFDSDLPKINVVPQDIGRVLLNLINNAFQAVHERSCKGEEDFNPEVILSTKTRGDKVEISVKDNGPGIPNHIKEKIFQPFFTTKPTGEGTGLGLSLSYDIVKAHGGEIKVASKPNDGTSFTILLPIH